jgi:extracellular factor (EF) 3-hydroxypalmitic acid methyl ester biosynthesis protein
METIKNTLAQFQTSQGLQLRATIKRLSRHQIVFEVYHPSEVIRLSESLDDFKILLSDQPVYSGRAIVTNVVNGGTFLLCEANLEDSWLDVNFAPALNGKSKAREDFENFMRASQHAYHVTPEFKLAVADMQILLQDMRQWFDQAEISVQSLPTGNRQEFELQIVEELREAVVPMLRLLFEKFEHTCRAVPPEFQPAHRNYVKRQLHPIVLCAPFMYRTYQKPLGYAGDYEMVNMMVRDPREGASMFAKVLNTFFLDTPPVIAHQNRVVMLEELLAREVSRVARQGRTAKIFNLGCGPAKEIQNFIARSELSGRARFTLLDFNEETIVYTQSTLQHLINEFRRTTVVQMVKKSVVQLIKEAAKPHSALLTSDFDVVYCAGLFDYLPDYMCEHLMGIFYKMVAPGGLLIATNVDDVNPARNWMEYSVDWHLIYRNHDTMRKLVPNGVHSDDWRIRSEPSGVNIFVEVRKPERT